MWYILVSVLIVITCIILIFVVLVQNSKGGGLASNFSGGNQFGGVAQTNKFLERLTWGLAITLLVFSLVASISIPRQQEGDSQSDIYEHIQSYDYNTNPTVPVDVKMPEEE